MHEMHEMHEMHVPFMCDSFVIHVTESPRSSRDFPAFWQLVWDALVEVQEAGDN